MFGAQILDVVPARHLHVLKGGRDLLWVLAAVLLHLCLGNDEPALHANAGKRLLQGVGLEVGQEVDELGEAGRLGRHVHVC